MTTNAISVRGLCKRYRIGVSERRPETFVGALASLIRAPFSNLSRLRALTHVEEGDGEDLIWALKDVSFEVPQGEVLGIVGRNGAGKSTLLKVLARIVDPTSGGAFIRGRVASLLEVGTGFHPELTGRENVYLNGTILGMKKAEIDAKFDEIVAFSGVERFLETPIKRYSSGMKVRLAFAVAAHLEPEILLIDEVLAVGDAEFRRKCMGKMRSVARAGRTVLFVSHQMAAVRVLCDKALLLSSGRVSLHGSTQEVVDAYESDIAEATASGELRAEEGVGDETVQLRAVRILVGGEVAKTVSRSRDIVVEIAFDVLTGSPQLNPHLHVHNALGTLLFISTNLHDAEDGSRTYLPGSYSARCRVPGGLLNAGRHTASVFVIRDHQHIHACLEEAISFEVLDDGMDRGGYAGGWQGAIRPILEWEIETE